MIVPTIQYDQDTVVQSKKMGGAQMEWVYWSDLSQTWNCYLHLDSQYVYQISAGLKHAYASYSDLRKVFEKKKKKNKKFLQNFADTYLGNGLRNLIKIWNLASPEWRLTSH